MFIDQAPMFGFAASFPLADTSENEAEDLFAENNECPDNTDGFGGNGVSVRVAKLG